jgi:TPP-dependent pyruvate/acetoin dehydrogenase alpha subunit
MIEAVVYRHEGHWMGDAQNYRDRETEFRDYRDPVEVLEGYLDPVEAARLREDALAELERGAQKALAGPIPGPETIFKNIYAE